MGTITGSIDHAALTSLARGDGGAVRLGDFGRPWSLSLSCGYARRRDLPVQMREPAITEDDPDGELWRFVAYAATGGQRAAAVGLAGLDAVRWVYLGAIPPYGRDPEVGLVNDRASARGDAFYPLAEAAGGAVRLAMRVHEAWVTALFVDGGGAPIAVYVGFDDGDRAVAIALDAAGLGGLRDDRDGEETLRAAFEALAVAGFEPFTIVAPRVHDRGFIPVLAAGVPRFEADGIVDAWDLRATVIGSLPLPSRTLGLALGSIDLEPGRATAVPAAGDRADVIAFTDLGGEQVAWMLRVPGAATARWVAISFEDDVVIGDGAGGGGLDDPGLRVADGTDPWDSPGLVVSAAGSPLLWAGPDLTIEHGAVGLDDLGRMTTLVVIS